MTLDINDNSYFICLFHKNENDLNNTESEVNCINKKKYWYFPDGICK